jgi:hypothetical protein
MTPLCVTYGEEEYHLEELLIICLGRQKKRSKSYFSNKYNLHNEDIRELGEKFVIVR